jgi:hypothetical protein
MTAASPPCVRLPLRFDADAMRAAVAALPQDAWQPHFNTGYYNGDWSGVALRSFDDAPLPLAPGSGAARDTAHCDGFWRDQLARLQTGLRSARLLRLGPGASIHEHRDYDLGTPEGDLRVHIPIVTDAQVDFLLDGLRVPMQAGECWFLDLSRPHRVDNHGGCERIHLVVDCRPSLWFAAQIDAGSPDTPASLPSRGNEAFAAFRDHVHADPALQALLDGHQDSRTFVHAVLALAADTGHRFGEQDVRAAMAQGRRDWAEQWLV